MDIASPGTPKEEHKVYRRIPFHALRMYLQGGAHTHNRLRRSYLRPES